MDTYIHVKAERQIHVCRRAAGVGNAGAGNRRRGGPSNLEGVGVFALANGNAAGQGSLVVQHPVVRDLQIVAPAVNQDAAAALRTVLNSQPVDRGRIAQEVAWVAVWRVPVASAVAGREKLR